MAKEIKVNRIEPETVEVFTPEGTSLGKLNEEEFIDLRCQIKKNKAKGYYIYWNDKKVDILPDGFLNGRTDLFTSLMRKYDYLLDLKSQNHEPE